MRTKVSLLVGVLALTLVSCTRELKPDHKGVFLASGDRLYELSPVFVDSEFTAEGFLASFFSGDPAVTGRVQDTYLILYGEYKPFDLKAFVKRGERWEIDTTQNRLADQMAAGGMRKEPEMTKVRFTSPLRTGTYILEVQQSDSTTMHFAFRVE